MDPSHRHSHSRKLLTDTGFFPRSQPAPRSFTFVCRPSQSARHVHTASLGPDIPVTQYIPWQREGPGSPRVEQDGQPQFAKGQQSGASNDDLRHLRSRPTQIAEDGGILTILPQMVAALTRRLAAVLENCQLEDSIADLHQEVRRVGGQEEDAEDIQGQAQGMADRTRYFEREISWLNDRAREVRLELQKLQGTKQPSDQTGSSFGSKYGELMAASRQHAAPATKYVEVINQCARDGPKHSKFLGSTK